MFRYQHAIILITTLLISSAAFAQQSLNRRAENIVGLYEGVQGGMQFRAKIEKEPAGTYVGHIVYLQHDRDAHGRLLLDTKNPDHKLRTRPLNAVVLFSGLGYDADRSEWRGCKIYDPQRGISAKLNVRFADDGRLCLTGSLLGFKESVYWKKID